MDWDKHLDEFEDPETLVVTVGRTNNFEKETILDTKLSTDKIALYELISFVFTVGASTMLAMNADDPI